MSRDGLLLLSVRNSTDAREVERAAGELGGVVEGATPRVGVSAAWVASLDRTDNRLVLWGLEYCSGEGEPHLVGTTSGAHTAALARRATRLAGLMVARGETIGEREVDRARVVLALFLQSGVSSSAGLEDIMDMVARYGDGAPGALLGDEFMCALARLPRGDTIGRYLCWYYGERRAIRLQGVEEQVWGMVRMGVGDLLSRMATREVRRALIMLWESVRAGRCTRELDRAITEYLLAHMTATDVRTTTATFDSEAITLLISSSRTKWRGALRGSRLSDEQWGLALRTWGVRGGEDLLAVLEGKEERLGDVAALLRRSRRVLDRRVITAGYGCLSSGTSTEARWLVAHATPSQRDEWLLGKWRGRGGVALSPDRASITWFLSRRTVNLRALSILISREACLSDPVKLLLDMVAGLPQALHGRAVTGRYIYERLTGCGVGAVRALTYYEEHPGESLDTLVAGLVATKGRGRGRGGVLSNDMARLALAHSSSSSVLEAAIDQLGSTAMGTVLRGSVRGPWVLSKKRGSAAFVRWLLGYCTDKDTLLWFREHDRRVGVREGAGRKLGLCGGGMGTAGVGTAGVGTAGVGTTRASTAGRLGSADRLETGLKNIGGDGDSSAPANEELLTRARGGDVVVICDYLTYYYGVAGRERSLSHDLFLHATIHPSVLVKTMVWKQAGFVMSRFFNRVAHSSVARALDATMTTLLMERLYPRESGGSVRTLFDAESTTLLIENKKWRVALRREELSNEEWEMLVAVTAAVSRVDLFSFLHGHHERLFTLVTLMKNSQRLLSDYSVRRAVECLDVGDIGLVTWLLRHCSSTERSRYLFGLWVNARGEHVVPTREMVEWMVRTLGLRGDAVTVAWGEDTSKGREATTCYRLLIDVVPGLARMVLTTSVGGAYIYERLSSCGIPYAMAGEIFLCAGEESLSTICATLGVLGSSRARG